MIPINTIVELNPEAEELYQSATAPARATVRHYREDEYGYEKVFVEWDRDHWRHNGESDRWAYAAHFTIISLPDEMVEDSDYEIKDEQEDLQGALDAAGKIASHGEGFIMISLERDGDGDLYPKVIVSSSSDEAEVLFSEEILPLLGFDNE